MEKFKTKINKVDKEVNYKRGYITYNIFKYWSLIMFLIIIPLTPILITIFGFNSIEQYELEFSPEVTLIVLSHVSEVFLNKNNDILIKLLGFFPDSDWLLSFNSSVDLFFGLFNNNIITLNFVDGILFFNLSTFNDFLINNIGITSPFNNETLKILKNFADNNGKITYNTSNISEFSIVKIWWVIGPSIAIIATTMITSSLWAYFSKYNKKNTRGDQKL